MSLASRTDFEVLGLGLEGQVLGLEARDGAVHKILVRKLHRTAQFYPHTALHHKKFVNSIHHTANPTTS